MLAYFSAAPRTSLDTLPVCLRNENPNRLVSLWDIVNHFNAVQLCLAMGNFAMFQAKFEDARASARRPDPQDVANLLGQIIHVSRSCEQAGMTDLVMRFNGIQRHLTDRLPDTSTL